MRFANSSTNADEGAGAARGARDAGRGRKRETKTSLTRTPATADFLVVCGPRRRSLLLMAGERRSEAEDEEQDEKRQQDRNAAPRSIVVDRLDVDPA